jgi:hypothetical protein
MSRQAAKLLLVVILRHEAEQDAVLADIEKLCAKDEFDRYKRMIGKPMGTMLLEIINPIVGKYPELKPPEME